MRATCVYNRRNLDKKIFLKVVSLEFSVSFVVSISSILVCSRKEDFSLYVRKNSVCSVSTHGRVPRKGTLNNCSDYYLLCLLSVFLLTKSLQVI